MHPRVDPARATIPGSREDNSSQGQESHNDAVERLRAFLLEDYKLKVGYLTNHFSRMWTRFNFFISLETLVGGAMIAAAATDRKLDNPSQVALLGLLISLCWYLVGVQDRYLIAVYRSQIRGTPIELARNQAFVVVHEPAQLRDGALLLLSKPLANYLVGKTSDKWSAPLSPDRSLSQLFPNPSAPGHRSSNETEVAAEQPLVYGLRVDAPT